MTSLLDYHMYSGVCISVFSALAMWPWPTQQPTSSAHSHYPTSSLTYHHPQPNIVSPHAHPLSTSVHPPSQFPAGGQNFMYPSAAPPGEFPSFTSHIADQVQVDGWADQRQPSVQPESVALPFSSPLQPRGDVHITSPIPTLPPPPIHPSQQVTPTNVQQQQQPSPLPLTPSHPPQTHTITRTPFSMDFILREHAPSVHDGTELAQPVVQYPQGAGPPPGDLHEHVASGYQSGMGDVMYQAPQSHPPPLPHPHTPSPQLQQNIAQGYVEGGGVKQVTFDPATHYGDQMKAGLPPAFVPGGETGERLSVGQFPSTASPVPDAGPFTENLQPFPLHSNYSPPVSGATGKIGMESDGNEAPYSPPELIPEHQASDQSDGLNQSHDRNIQSESSRQLVPSLHDHSGSQPRVGEETNLTKEHQNFTTEYDSLRYRDGSPPGVGGVQNVTKHNQSQLNRTEIDQTTAISSAMSLPPEPPDSPESDGLLIDVAESPVKETKPSSGNAAMETEGVKAVNPPSHLQIRKSVSPSVDDFDVRPSAPKPPPLIRRGHNCSSDEEDDVFLPSIPHHNPPPPTITPSQEAPSQEAPSSPPSHTPSSPPTYVPPPTASPSPPLPPLPPSQQAQSHFSPPARLHSCCDSRTEEDEGDKMETTITPSKNTPTTYK